MNSSVRSATSLVLRIVCLGLIVFLGSWSGKKMARAGWFYGTTPAGKSAGNGSLSPPKRTTDSIRKGEVVSAVKRLHSIALGSPNLYFDYEAKAKIDTILAKLSAFELAAVYAKMESDRDGGMDILFKKIGAAWMAKDPDAAFDYAFDKSSDRGPSAAQSICLGWAADDPAAALAWLNAKELPAGFEIFAKNIRSTALLQLAERDFATTTAEILKTREAVPSGKEVEENLKGLGGFYADDPAMRARLIDFAKSTGHPEDYAALNSSLLRSWPQDDALGMLTYLQDLRGYLESDAVPAEARPKTAAAAVGAAINREYTTPALEWWMERYSQSTETPAPLSQAIFEWTKKYPDAAQQWFDQQPDSPQRDALNAAAVPAFIAKSKFAEAAESLAGIRDPDVRQPVIERLDLLWTARDPEAAAAWRATLPAGNQGGR